MQDERRQKRGPDIEKPADSLAFKDDLTKLHNRRYLYEYMPRILRDANENNYSVSLYMIDVDKFKEINNTYGHLRGDKVLTEVADLLRESFREYDEVIRYAGDEFVVVLPKADQKDSLKVARRLVAKVSQYVFAGDSGQPDLNLTLSLGLAVFPRDAKDAEQLIYRADEALYLSKRSGRNQVSVFTDVPDDILYKNKILEIIPTQELVGRNKEYEQSTGVLQASLDKKKSGVVLLSGEAGLGKTKFQSELRSYAQEKGMLCFSARCTEAISQQPYQVLSANFGRFLKSLNEDAGEVIKQIEDKELSQLFDLEPSLKEFCQRKVEASEADDKEARYLLFNGMLKLLSGIASLKPLFISLDNFQWADEASMSLISYIVEEKADAAIMFFCAFRESELSIRLQQEKSLNELFDKLSQSEACHRIDLKPFNLKQTKEMITAIFGQLGLDDKVIEVFHARTEGNPYYIEESLKNLAEKGLIYYKDKSWRAKEIKESDIASSIKDIIGERFASLDDETRQFLSTAAVLGQDFTIDDLTRMLEQNPGYAAEMIDRARQANLIEVKNVDNQEVVSFRNKLQWELLYNELPESERNKLHEKFARLAETSGKKDPKAMAGILAYHFNKAHDAQKASDYAKIAREQAMRSFIPAEAGLYLQQVLSQELEGLKEEEEEELALAVESIKEQDYPAVSKLIISLKTGIVNYGLYPAASKVRKDSVQEIYEHLNNLLGTYEIISFSEVDGFLLVNGEEIASQQVKKSVADSLGALLKTYRIQSMSFERGISQREIDVLLSTLSKKTAEIDEAGGLPVFLKNNNVVHIKLNMVRYEKILRKKLGQPHEKKRKLNEVMLINYLLGKAEQNSQARDSLLGVLEKDPTYLAKLVAGRPEAGTQDAAAAAEPQTTVDLKEQAKRIEASLKKINEDIAKEDETKQEEYRKKLPQMILELPPDLRAEIMKQKTLKESGVSQEDITTAFDQMPDEDIISILKEEIRRLSEGKATLDDIKDYIRRFLDDETRRLKILNALKGDILSAGITEAQFDNLLKPDLWKELSYDEKLEKINSLTPESFVDQDIMESTKQVFYELLADSQDETVNEILNKILANLDADKEHQRKFIAENLAGIIDVLGSNNAVECMLAVESVLAKHLLKEQSIDIYKIMIEQLKKILTFQLKNRIFKPTVQLLGYLKDLIKDEGFAEEKKQSIHDIFQVFKSKEITKEVIEVFNHKNNRDNLEAVLQLADYLNKEALDDIIEIIGRPNRKIDPYDAFLNRQYMAKLLIHFGPKAEESLRHTLSSSRQPETLKNIIEVMALSGGKLSLEALKAYREHRDEEVKRKAAKAIEKIQSRLKKQGDTQ